MEKFQNINSELFALNALQPEQMRKVIGGRIVSGAGGFTANEGSPTGSTTTSWASDADDGSKQGVGYSGPDAGLYTGIYGGNQGNISNLGNSHAVPFPSSGGVVVINVNPPACGNSKNSLNSRLD